MKKIFLGLCLTANFTFWASQAPNEQSAQQILALLRNNHPDLYHQLTAEMPALAQTQDPASVVLLKAINGEPNFDNEKCCSFSVGAMSATAITGILGVTALSIAGREFIKSFL